MITRGGVEYSPNVPAGLEQLRCNGILRGVPVNLLSLGRCSIFFALVVIVAATEFCCGWCCCCCCWPLVIIIPLFSSKCVAPDTADRLLLLLLWLFAATTLPPQKDDSLGLPAKSNQIRDKHTELIITCQHINSISFPVVIIHPHPKTTQVLDLLAHSITIFTTHM